MFEAIEILFSQSFLIRALLVGVVISLCSALLGVSLVLKRFSMIGDGLSHVGFGALAVATVAGWSPLYFSLPIVVLAAFLLLKLNESGKMRGDAAIALISTGALAVGIMVTSMTTGVNIDIYNYMFGSILTMSTSDVYLSAILSVVIIIVFIANYSEIFSITFDESFAKATGTKVSLYNMLIAALTAVTIVIGMRMMGALLISSLIIFPSITSMRLCKTYKHVVISSCFLSVLCFLVGLVVSIRFEAPTGASVVCTNIFMFGVYFILNQIREINPDKKLYPLKKFLMVLVIIITVVAILLCMLTGTVTTYDSDSKISIVATSFPQYDFARAVVGENADITMLLAPGEETHTYDPTPQDIIAIQECDIFIYGGGESDSWVTSMLDSIDTEDKEFIRFMDLVELYEEEVVEGMQTDSASDKVFFTEYDEHVWTSPINSIEFVNQICDVMCELDSENSATYTTNAFEYITALYELDEAFETIMDNATIDSIMIGDRFPFLYLVNEYDIEYYAAFKGCSSDVEANPTTIAYLIDKANAEEIPVVFKVDLSTGLVAQTISESTGAEILTLYSCHTLSNDDFEAGVTYIDLMYRNADALSIALGSSY